MPSMKHRKSYDEMSKTGRYLYERQLAGKPLPPSMRRGTLKYAQSKGWNGIQQRTVNGHPLATPRNGSHLRKGLTVSFTREQFNAWVESRWSIYEKLYADGKTPSVDRIDNAIGYSLENLQVIDLKLNMAKDRRKPVVAVNVVTGEVRKYGSAIEAEVDGFDHTNISSACYRKRGSHGGWRWSFA